MRIVPSNPCGSQGANFTTGVREREDANRNREVGDSILVKTEALPYIRPSNQRIRMMIRIVPSNPCDLYPNP